MTSLLFVHKYLMHLYVDDFDRVSNIPDQRVKQLFARPRGHWFCGGSEKIQSSVERFMKRVDQQVPVCVIYNIPNRDLGSFSRGGAHSSEQYLEFITSFSRGVGDKKAIIIFEPDALPHAIMNGETLLKERIKLMNDALKIIADTCNNTLVYVDVGHPRWIDAKFISKTLKKVYNYRGISINVSNFVPTQECEDYGNSIGLPFVIDTSRNGNEQFDTFTDGWCNPKGRLIGTEPHMVFDDLLDGYLWIKVPGESDGSCNGGPKAGKFWKDYAIGLLNEIKG